MEKRELGYLGFAILFILTMGCTHRQDVKRCDRLPAFSSMTGHRTGGICGSTDSSPKVDPGELGRRNQEILEMNFAMERSYLDGRRPELGLALSGGGTRAASFSIGVMKALQEEGILDRIDVISSVSGGSYASYWYFMQNYYLNRENLPEPGAEKLSGNFMSEHYTKGREEFREQGADLLFEDLDFCRPDTLNNLSTPERYRFQYTLQNSSEILSLDKKTGLLRDIRNGAQYAINLGAQGLSVPFHWILNGLVFNWDANINPYRHFYQNGLERSYGYVPLSYTLREFANDDSAWGFKWVNAKDISFKDMGEYLQEYKRNNQRRLPFFIINATADYKSLIQQSERKELLKAVYEFTPWGCGSGLTGYVPVESCPSDISMGRAVSISGAAVAGQSEAIDSTGDSEGKITALSVILSLLNLDFGYKIRNHDPNASQVGNALYKLIPFPVYYFADWAVGKKVNDILLSDGGHMENLGIFSLVRRGVKKIIVVDGEQDGSSTFSSLNRLKRNLNREMGMDIIWTDPAINVYYTPADKGLLEAEIRGFVDENGNKDDIKLYYIKLSIKQDDLETTDEPCDDTYPFTVVAYGTRHADFPHEPTADVFYTRDQYKAYRDLGYTIGRKLQLQYFIPAENEKKM